MDQSRRTHLEKLKRLNRERLNVLELKQAQLGINCPPEIHTEIEGIKKFIGQIESEIATGNSEIYDFNESQSSKPVRKRNIAILSDF